LISTSVKLLQVRGESGLHMFFPYAVTQCTRGI